MTARCAAERRTGGRLAKVQPWWRDQDPYKRWRRATCAVFVAIWSCLVGGLVYRSWPKSVPLEPTAEEAREAELREESHSWVTAEARSRTWERLAEWADVLEWEPDEARVRDPATRARIAGIGLPWRVKGKHSGIAFVVVPPGTYVRSSDWIPDYSRKV